ncbi:hypothetical protein [Anaerosalibacter massiliensis]|uniref:hypothetical protein n=1 Tax=Anaerosalibacter massiliensis TaxID=1347392 RepID=UPI00164D801A|nr:hypothetical protein [Anaerosalibacter massiliensis]
MNENDKLRKENKELKEFIKNIADDLFHDAQQDIRVAKGIYVVLGEYWKCEGVKEEKE